MNWGGTPPGFLPLRCNFYPLALNIIIESHEILHSPLNFVWQFVFLTERSGQRKLENFEKQFMTKLRGSVILSLVVLVFSVSDNFKARKFTKQKRLFAVRCNLFGSPHLPSDQLSAILMCNYCTMLTLLRQNAGRLSLLLLAGQKSTGWGYLAKAAWSMSSPCTSPLQRCQVLQWHPQRLCEPFCTLRPDHSAPRTWRPNSSKPNQGEWGEWQPGPSPQPLLLQHRLCVLPRLLCSSRHRSWTPQCNLGLCLTTKAISKKKMKTEAMS